MQKRKFKLNILDIIIFIVILCSVALLIFRDVVDETFKKPETISFDLSVYVEGAGKVEKAAKMNGQAVLFKPMIDEETQFEINVKSVEVKENPVAASNECTVTISFTGYKRFGRYYTQSGERVYENTECVFVYGETQIQGNAVLIEDKVK